MTAIAGVWCLNGRPNASDSCGRVLAVQELYGRDGTAQWAKGSIALGRSLSRSVPEDKFDRQPLFDKSKRRVLVADVRLDNRNELIRSLGIPSELSLKLCDADILLAAFEKWEEACFQHLVGDYAFALWDDTRQ